MAQQELTSAKGPEVESSEPAMTSIYDYWKPKKFKLLLIVSLASILVPFCDTIYLPALTVRMKVPMRLFPPWCITGAQVTPCVHDCDAIRPFRRT